MQKFQKSGAVSCKFKGRQCQPLILHFLTGKKFVRILKTELKVKSGYSMECFSGKGKGKQIDTLKKFSQMWKLSIASILKRYVPFSLFNNYPAKSCGISSDT